MRLRIAEDLAERRAYLDPHGGQAATTIKAGLARAAIVDVARDRWNRIWVLDAWAARVSTEDMVEQIVIHYHRWTPGLFGIEVAGQQRLFVDTVQTILRLRGEPIPIDGVQVSTRQDKLYRIRTVVQPVIAEHRLFVRNDLLELRAELASFPTGHTVDLVDALAGAIGLLPIAAATVAQEALGVRQFAESLREAGIPEEEVCNRLLEEFGEDAVDTGLVLQ